MRADILSATYKLAAIGLLTASAAIITNMMTSGFYDSDIDHEIYFGQRLLQGELIWTREFHDKLPAVPILFAIPAAIGSVIAWQVLTISIMCAAALSIWKVVADKLLDHWDAPTSERRDVALLTSSAFLYLCAALPGGFYTINITAASLVTISLIALMCVSPDLTMSNRKTVSLVIISAFMASLAISIRPYYLLACLVLPVWASVRCALMTSRDAGLRIPRRSETSRRLEVKLPVTWWASLIAFGLLVNASPYLMSGNVSAFMGGLKILSQDINPQSIAAILEAQVNSLLSMAKGALIIASCSFFASAILVASSATRHKGAKIISSLAAVDILFIAIIMPALVELMFIGKHVQFHYLQLFIPYWTLSFVTLFAFLPRLSRRLDPIASKLALAGFLTVTFLAVTASAFKNAYSAYERVDRRHSWYSYIAPLESYLSERRASGQQADFLSPSNMYLHWQLTESRHGFPHAANTGHIFAGWFSALDLPDGLTIPRNEAEYCRMLILAGPTVVLEREHESDVERCLDSHDSPYSLDGEISGVSDDSLLIYIRER